MPIEPTAPPGVRIYARIDRFHFECPYCLWLVVSDIDPKRSHQRDIQAQRAAGYKGGRPKRSEGSIRARARENPAHPYNSFLQLVVCPQCGRTFFVGLLLWSPPLGVRHLYIAPADAKPDRRQRAAQRQYTISKWAKMTKRSGESVNVLVEGECVCANPSRLRADCPVHGEF